MPSPVKNLNQDAFVDILKSKEPWIIDFYAPWCGHCQVFAPEFKWIAEVGGQILLSDPVDILEPFCNDYRHKYKSHLCGQLNC